MDSIRRAAKIKEALYVRGLTFADLDRSFDMPPGTARTTLRDPNAKGEAAIATALGVDARKLWPERYDTQGVRLQPQPSANYERPPTLRQRRIGAAA